VEHVGRRQAGGRPRRRRRSAAFRASSGLLFSMLRIAEIAFWMMDA
jgi:hypothetical protein